MIISVFNETFKEFGLELAIKKTDLMMNNAHNQEHRDKNLQFLFKANH